jgi:hypothetical protein
MFKVLSGTIRADDVLVNTRSGTKERLHNLVTLVGGSQTHIDTATAGDIVAVTKLADTRTGDTLAPDGTPVSVPVPALPRPVYGVAIAAAKQSDEDRLATTLHRLLVEDPTLAVHHDDTTGQTVLSGGGETHVRVALSRIERAGVALDVDDVRVAYRSRLAAGVEVEGKHKKQSGGHGQFGVATVRFEPLPLGSGYRFDSEVTGGAIPKNLIPAIGAGIEDAMARGCGRRLPDRRPACRVHRRQAPRRRLVRDELQDGGIAGVARSGREGGRRGARTGERHRGARSCVSPGRRARRPHLTAGAGARHRHRRDRRHDRAGDRADRRDPALRDRSAIAQRRQRLVHRRPPRLPAAAAQPRRAVPTTT